MDTIRDPSLVVHAELWKKDGGVFADSSAYGHLWTVIGAAWGMQGRTFDGVDDEIDGPSLSSAISDSPFTLGVWFKTTQSAGVPEIVGSMEGGAGSPDKDKGFTLYIDGATGKLNLLTGNGVSFPSVASNAAINDGRWHFATATRLASTGAGNLVMDVDGVLQTATANPGGISLNTGASLTLGNRPPEDTVNTYFAGQIGEVLFYRFRALTSIEKANLYRATKFRYA